MWRRSKARFHRAIRFSSITHRNSIMRRTQQVRIIQWNQMTMSTERQWVNWRPVKSTDSCDLNIDALESILVIIRVDGIKKK